MLTLFHAPHSRSTRVLQLLIAMQALDAVEVVPVGIERAMTGTCDAGPRSPHPEGKVPLLVEDGVAIRETVAILLHLTDLFPAAGLGVSQGERERGAYLAWLAWYAGVMEPVMILSGAGLSHPWLQATIRGLPEMTARLDEALARDGWLVGGRFTAADLICASPYLWFKDIDPGTDRVRDWVARCSAHPARIAAMAMDEVWAAEARRAA